MLRSDFVYFHLNHLTGERLLKQYIVYEMLLDRLSARCVSVKKGMCTERTGGRQKAGNDKKVQQQQQPAVVIVQLEKRLKTSLCVRYTQRKFSIPCE